MAKLILYLLICLSVTACATTPTSLKETTQVPSERIFYQQQASPEGMSKAIFVRDRGYLMGGAYLHLFINGSKAASIETGERLELLLNPGEYVFGVKPTDYFGAYTLYSIDQVLQAGKTYYYRLLIDTPYPGGGVLPRVQRFMPEANAVP
jgi:hypothetical protein